MGGGTIVVFCSTKHTRTGPIVHQQRAAAPFHFPYILSGSTSVYQCWRQGFVALQHSLIYLSKPWVFWLESWALAMSWKLVNLVLNPAKDNRSHTDKHDSTSFLLSPFAFLVLLPYKYLLHYGHKRCRIWTILDKNTINPFCIECHHWTANSAKYTVLYDTERGLLYVSQNKQLESPITFSWSFKKILDFFFQILKTSLYLGTMKRL